MTDDRPPGLTEGHPERIELQRSAQGRYYWKIVVVGDLDDAVDRAVKVDQLLKAYYGKRLAPDPRPDYGDENE